MLGICGRRYGSPVSRKTNVLTPIKCTYACDYYQKGNEPFFVLGSFWNDADIHEYLHHVVHGYLLKYSEVILKHTASYPHIGRSYYLNGGADGRLNAFEEYLVRRLTDDILQRKLPMHLDDHIREALKGLE